MRTQILIAGLLAMGIHVNATCKCMPTRCAIVGITVTSCVSAHVTVAGNVVLGNGPKSLPEAPIVNGVLIVATNRSEHTIPCYRILPRTEVQPSWVKRNENEFFVETDSDLCRKILNTHIRGVTEFPCCDIPSHPSLPHPGTCTVEKRQLTISSIDKKK
jgi:hypothetical protein